MTLSQLLAHAGTIKKHVDDLGRAVPALRRAGVHVPASTATVEVERLVGSLLLLHADPPRALGLARELERVGATIPAAVARALARAGNVVNA